MVTVFLFFFVFLMGRIFITWKKSQKTQKREEKNVLHRINKLSLYDKLFTGLYEKGKKYTIESVLTSHSESCTAYLLLSAAC